MHRLYNPERITQYNIIPGLIGVILTMTMVMMTGLAMTRERERGTMENLLATPAKPIEVITGKIIPYIFIGLIQATIVILASLFIFMFLFWECPIDLCCNFIIYRSKFDSWDHIFFSCEKSTSGGATHFLLFFAQYSAVRLYVSLCWNATLGTNCGIGITHDLF